MYTMTYLIIPSNGTNFVLFCRHWWEVNAYKRLKLKITINGDEFWTLDFYSSPLIIKGATAANVTVTGNA